MHAPDTHPRLRPAGVVALEIWNLGVPARSTALVLTIGFGVGGALLLPRSRDARQVFSVARMAIAAIPSPTPIARRKVNAS